MSQCRAVEGPIEQQNRRFRIRQATKRDLCILLRGLEGLVTGLVMNCMRIVPWAKSCGHFFSEMDGFAALVPSVSTTPDHTAWNILLFFKSHCECKFWPMNCTNKSCTINSPDLTPNLLSLLIKMLHKRFENLRIPASVSPPSFNDSNHAASNPRLWGTFPFLLPSFLTACGHRPTERI